MSLIKLFLGGNNLVFSRPERVWSVTSRLGTGKWLTLFYSVACYGQEGVGCWGGWGFTITIPTKNNLSIRYLFYVEIFNKDVLGSTVWFGLPVRAISRHNAVLHETVRPGVIVFRFQVPNVFRIKPGNFLSENLKKYYAF
jgi:hypothetical protein